jgi:hypothetical protein
VQKHTLGRVVVALVLTAAATLVGAGTAMAAPAGADGCYVNVLSKCYDD